MCKCHSLEECASLERAIAEENERYAALSPDELKAVWAGHVENPTPSIERYFAARDRYELLWEAHAKSHCDFLESL